MNVLGYAQAADQSSSSVVIIVIAATLILLVSGLAFLPVYAAWKRRHGRADNIVAFALMWGLLAAAALMNMTVSQIKWSREHMENLQSGYLEPDAASDAPKPPWIALIALTVSYGGLIAWSLRGRPAVRRANSLPNKPQKN